MTPLPIGSNVFVDSASAHGWTELNESTFISSSLAVLRSHLGPGFSEYSFYIFSPPRADTMPASANEQVALKVLLFLSDESASVPHHLADRYTAIFKAYLPFEATGANIFQLSLGAARDVPTFPPLPMAERPLDIFFSGNLNANRMALYRAISPVLRWIPVPDAGLLAILRRSGLGRLFRRDFSGFDGELNTRIVFSDGFKRGLAPAEYGELLTRSKVVLCPKGFQSAETFRHVEALRAGSVVVSEPLPDTSLYRGSPIIEVENWRDGLATARALAADVNRLDDLQARGLEWYRSVLSPEATGTAMHAALASLRPATERG